MKLKKLATLRRILNYHLAHLQKHQFGYEVEFELFTCVWLSDSLSFLRGPNPSKVLQQLLMLQPEQQLSIFHTLQSSLRERDMLPPAGAQAE